MVIDHLLDGMILWRAGSPKNHLHLKYEKYYLRPSLRWCSCFPQQSSFGENKRLNAQLHSTLGEVVCWGRDNSNYTEICLRDPETDCFPQRLGLNPCSPSATTMWEIVTLQKLGIWVFPKIGVPQNGWVILENPIKNGWFGGTTIFGNIHLCFSPHPVIATATFGWLSPCEFEYSVHCICCS